jgi:hypothetical protein
MSTIPLQRAEPVPRSPAAPEVPFSLFENDRLQRVYAWLGLGSHRSFYMVKRCFYASAFTYVPMALLAWAQGLAGLDISPENFFADFAAYACFLVGLPLFLVAEVIINGSTREAADQFVRCGVVSAEDLPRVYRIHGVLKRWRESIVPDAVCLFIAYLLAAAILEPQFFGPKQVTTWHVARYSWGHFLTLPGVWAFFIALPLLNYIWLRMMWKTFLWIYYLYHVSRVRLDLHPTHPDLTGGIGFVSEAQGRFAIFILAYGITNVAAPVAYQIAVQGYDISIMPVWGPIVGFIVGAPLLFTLPLFMFTKQLFRTKKRALAAYRERVSEHSRQFEKHWLYTDKIEPGPEEMRQLAEQSTLGLMYTRIEHMRVVPFDLRSFSQLLGSTLGAMSTLLPLLHSKGDLAEIFEAIGKFLGHFGGGGH